MLTIEYSCDKRDIYYQFIKMMKFYFKTYFLYSDLYIDNLFNEYNLVYSNVNVLIITYLSRMAIKEINEAMHLVTILLNCKSVNRIEKIYQFEMTRDAFSIAQICPDEKIKTFLDYINYLTKEFRVFMKPSHIEVKEYINYLFLLIRSVFETFDSSIKLLNHTTTLINKQFVDKYLV
jgi:hypothetical protein